MKPGDRFDYAEFVRLVEDNGSNRKSKGLFKCHGHGFDCEGTYVRVIVSMTRRGIHPKSCGCMNNGRIEIIPASKRTLKKSLQNTVLTTAWR